MPLKLIAPRIGKTPYWAVRGHYLGIYVDRSTKATRRDQAARIKRKWESEIEVGVFAQPGEPTFLDAAVRYMAATGNQRYMPPVLEHFGKTLLKSIDQTAIDDAAVKLYPEASAATRNRQVYTVVSAVLKHAGMDARLRRPKGWRGSQATAWLWPEQAFKVFEEADKVDREFGIFLRFLCYTGARLQEATALKIGWLSLAEATAYREKTKNDDPRTYYLPPVLVAELASHPRGLKRPTETIFRFRKNGRLYALLGRVRAAVAPDITITGFHMFRHTWATWMRRYGGLDTTGLLATGAWRDAASARRYEHVVVTEEAQKAVLLPVEKLRKKAV